MIARRTNHILNKMEDMYDNTGCTSLLVIANGINYKNAAVHSFVVPSGVIRRPVIAQPVINNIGKSLQDSLKYNPINVNFFDENNKILITKDDAVKIISR